MRARNVVRAKVVIVCLIGAAVLLPSMYGLVRRVAAREAASAAYFSDVTASANISFTHVSPGTGLDIGNGAAWIDYNGDGWIDLYVTQRMGPNEMYRNLGGGLFEEVGATVGVQDAGHDGAGVAAADFNNDGWRDLYLANGDDDVLLKNVGGAVFVDVTTTAGLDSLANRGTSAAWGDYDRDGYLDLYVSNHEHLDGLGGEHGDYLFHNNGDETFTDVSYLVSSVVPLGYGFIGAWTDYDDDGDVDIFLVNDCPFGPAETRLFRNDGGGGPLSWTFTEVADSLGIGACAAGMGIAIGDVDHDGSFDYFYSNIGQPFLFDNDGGVFSDVTVSAGLTPTASVTLLGKTRWTWGANFFDFNNDSWLDLYICSGELLGGSTPQANLLFENTGGFSFVDTSFGSGADDTDRSRSSVTGDYDNDGDLDLFVHNYASQGRLYANGDASGNHYLRVALVGTLSNRDGIGAKLRVESAGGTQYAEVHSGTSLGGGDEIKSHFGLGPDTLVTTLFVRWPSGARQYVYNIPADVCTTITEPTTPVTGIPDGPDGDPRMSQNYPNPFNPLTTIDFSLERPGPVKLVVYDARGDQVRVLLRQRLPRGDHSVIWDGYDDRGRDVVSGVYFYRLEAGARVITRKAVLIR